MQGEKETLGEIIMPLEIARAEGKLNNAKQIEQVIEKHAGRLTVYGALTVVMGKNETYRY